MVKNYARPILSVVLAAGAAYCLSFAIDLLVGALFGLYPPTVYVPVVTWSIISIILIYAARIISRNNRLTALPFIGFGILAIFGGIVGHHPINFLVAGVLFVYSYIIWKDTGIKPQTEGSLLVSDKWDERIRRFKSPTILNNSAEKKDRSD